MSYVERVGAAMENGQMLTVVGDELKVGSSFPAPLSIYRYNPERGRIVHENLSALTTKGALVYPVNSFTIKESEVCRREAGLCDGSEIAKQAKALGIWVAGISNDDPLELHNFQEEYDIQNHEMWVGGPDFARETGTHIKEYNGQYQRGLWAVYRGEVVYSEYVFDQGGPIPDFEAAFKVLEIARGNHGLPMWEAESL